MKGRLDPSLDEFLQQFELVKPLNDQTDGFWDSYDRTALWLGHRISVSIMARSVSEEILVLYQKIFAEPEKYDTMWRQFAVAELLPQMRDESENEPLAEQHMLQELTVGTLSFGDNKDGLAMVWYSFPERSIEVLLDKSGTPIWAGTED